MRLLRPESGHNLRLMSDFQTRMNDIEVQARKRRISIRDLCKQAGVAASNWARWKRGISSPTFSKWEKVEATANRLFNEPSTPSPGDTAAHDAGPLSGPNPENGESPRVDAGEDRAGVPAGVDG